MKKQVLSPKGVPVAVGPYNVAIRTGDLLFISGQMPLDPATGAIVPGGVEEQCHQVFKNIRTILESEGLTLENVVKTTVFMTDLGEFAKVNAVYAVYFPKDAPARSSLQSEALPKGAKIEIEVIATY